MKMLKNHVDNIHEIIHLMYEEMEETQKEIISKQKAKWIQAVAKHVAPSTVIKITEEVEK